MVNTNEALITWGGINKVKENLYVTLYIGKYHLLWYIFGWSSTVLIAFKQPTHHISWTFFPSYKLRITRKWERVIETNQFRYHRHPDKWFPYYHPLILYIYLMQIKKECLSLYLPAICNINLFWLSLLYNQRRLAKWEN